MINPMLAGGDKARLQDEDMRARFAIRRELTAMAAEEREMERAMKAFEEDADQAKRYIEAEWRREHWGHEPEHPPAWQGSGPILHSRRRKPAPLA